MKSRCSVFIKILTKKLHGESILYDILASHSTWESYSSMNRVYKFYNLPDIENNHSWIQMSSYPGNFNVNDFE